MAKMYPAVLATDSNIPHAEQSVFAALESQLSNSYSVFHSFHWTEATNTPREIDFIILHPEKGFLVLEVKGGTVSVDTGQWFSRNAQGQFHIKNPFQQAQRAMYFLMEFYEKQNGKPFPGLATYGVCFPDSEHRTVSSHPEMTQLNSLFGNQLAKIAAWIEKLYAHTIAPEQKKRGMTQEATLAFTNILRPTMHTALSIRTALERQQEELRHINFFQDYLLDIFEHKNRVAFQGTAGTGKTWLALKKAVRLQRDGKNCLLLCYNALLGKELGEIAQKMWAEPAGSAGQMLAEEPAGSATGGTGDNAGGGRLDIHTFHAFANKTFINYIEWILNANTRQQQLFGDLMQELFPDGNITDPRGLIGHISRFDPKTHGRDITKQCQQRDIDERIINLLATLLSAQNADEYFQLNVPVALLTLLEDSSYPAPTYDALLIDEAQDFHKDWCDCLAHFFTKARRRIIYIFYDDNQNIFMKHKQLPISKLINKHGLTPYLYKLRNNIRNTRAIHDYACQQTNLGRTAKSMTMEGLPPRRIQTNSAAGARKEVGKIVADLLQNHQMANADIAVITNTAVKRSIFANHKEIGNFKLTDTGKGTTGKHIRLRSIGQFKGLESDIIILVLQLPESNAPTGENRNELLYVGYTRAKFLLYIVEHPAA